MLLYAGFTSMMLFGSTMMDPGGLKGVAIVIASIAAIVAVATLDRRVPRAGLLLLIAMGVAGVGFHMLCALDVLHINLSYDKDIAAWSLTLAFTPIAMFSLAAWHAWHHGIQGAAVMIVFGLLMLTVPTPGIALATPAVVSGVLICSAERIGLERALYDR